MEHNRNICKRERGEGDRRFGEMGRREEGKRLRVNRGDFKTRTGRKGAVIMMERRGQR